jgi:hypothetical protein
MLWVISNLQAAIFKENQPMVRLVREKVQDSSIEQYTKTGGSLSQKK